MIVIGIVQQTFQPQKENPVKCFHLWSPLVLNDFNFWFYCCLNINLALEIKHEPKYSRDMASGPYRWRKVCFFPVGSWVKKVYLKNNVHFISVYRRLDFRDWNTLHWQSLINVESIFNKLSLPCLIWLQLNINRKQELKWSPMLQQN